MSIVTDVEVTTDLLCAGKPICIVRWRLDGVQYGVGLTEVETWPDSPAKRWTAETPVEPTVGADAPYKPHKGHIKNWFKEPFGCEGYGLGYMIRGEFVDHPEFAGCLNGHTSYVVAHDELGNVETKNSRYSLIGPAVR